MKRVEITRENQGKIKDAIKVVEGQCTARCIDASDAYWAVEHIREWTHLSDSALNGCKFVIDVHAGSYDARYYAPQSTQVTVKIAGGKWYITDIKRDYCRRYQVTCTEMTEYAKEMIIKNMMKF